MKASTSKPSPGADRRFAPSSPRLPGRLEKIRNMIDGHPQRSAGFGWGRALDLQNLKEVFTLAKRKEDATLFTTQEI